MTQTVLPEIGRREHFCTMVDGNFLPMGIALHESLRRHDPSAVLWVLCLDELSERALSALRRPGLFTIRLQDVETAELKQVRGSRTAREYFWTLTPWTFEWVFERAPDALRVTYVDADLYFFQSPAVLLDGMTASHEALITHHAYAPQYDYTSVAGPYCVQFVTARRTCAALATIRWWRDRCIEWCYARAENNRFGDQRYLEQWPARLGDALLIVNRHDLTGAPWNACMAEYLEGTDWQPVFYHFHGFRYLSGDRALLKPSLPDYEIGPRTWNLYRTYVSAIRRASRQLRRIGFPIEGLATPQGFEDYDSWGTVLRRIARTFRRRFRPLHRRPIVSVR